MLIQEQDLVQYKVGKKKAYGFINRDRYLNASGEDVIEVRQAEDPTVFVEISEGDIVCNYGDSPNLDDLKIEVKSEAFVTKLFGNVDVLRPLLDSEKKVILDTFEKVRPVCEQFAIFPTRIFIRPNKGDKVGCCKYNKKEGINEISLMPDGFDVDNLSWIVYHEVAHAVWNHLVPENFKAKWIRLYDKNMERKKVLSSEVATLREDLISSGYTVSEYIKTMEDGLIIKKVMKYIKETFNLKPAHIDVLISQGDQLTNYWPTDSVQVSDYNVFVSKYAQKSPEEFFAESFSYFYLKAGLPESVVNAVTKTLKVIGVYPAQDQQQAPSEE